MLQRDYLMRMIQQLAEAVAALVGLARAGRTEEALKQLDGQYSGLLGLPRATLDRLDAASVRAVVGDKIELVVKLVEAEAEVLRAGGREEEAARREARARALRGGG